MTATTGSDPSGPVQYYFDETSGNPGGSDSGWQTSTSYTDTGLTGSTQYTYTVQMRDSVPNTGTASSPANATTQAPPDTTPPTPNPATFASAPSADSSSAISMTATTGSDPSGPVEYYFDETSGNPGGSDSGWQTSASYTDTGLDADTQYTYTVQMRDSVPNTGTASSPANATTDPSGWTQIQYDDFEGGFGNWNDGGADCKLYTGGTYAHQGSNALDLEDNTSTSVATTGNLVLAGYAEIKVDFWYRCQSMDNSNEDFWLQISTNGGSNFTTVEEWNEGDEFVNGQFYPDSVIITGYTLTDQTQIRFRCDASGGNDDVYIDEVVVSASGEPVPDYDPPTPNPATWASVPSADSSSAISMTATTGSDINGVEYEFDETSGNPGGSDSGWQSSASYTDSGLDADTQYTYRVQMRDQSVNQNTGSWSTSESTTTDPASSCPGGVYTDYVGAGHATDVVASASSSDGAVGVASKTIDGSGLTGNQHGTYWEDGWVSDIDAGSPPAASPNPARGTSQWIHYDLGYQYPLAVMHVWNTNENYWQDETDRGLNSITIDYSDDGTNWTELGTYSWPQAPGVDTYTGFDGPDFGGTCARYVLITINSNHGDPDYGLSEVQLNLAP
jgi:hypothetical protein